MRLDGAIASPATQGNPAENRASMIARTFTPFCQRCNRAQRDIFTGRNRTGLPFTTLIRLGAWDENFHSLRYKCDILPLDANKLAAPKGTEIPNQYQHPVAAVD